MIITSISRFVSHFSQTSYPKMCAVLSATNVLIGNGFGSRTFARELKSLANVVIAMRSASFSKVATGGANSSESQGKLVGKVALITGAASGLGKATAQEFVRNGARVIIADINSDLGSEVARSLGPSAHFVRCDVTDEAQVAEAVDAALTRHGKLNVMYNNAGITGRAIPPGIADLDLEEFDRVIRVNLRGTVAGIKHAARVMIPAGSGSILCTSSISGILAGLGPHPYTVSKFAIPGLVRSAAAELCGHGIRVNSISPAPVPTPMSVGQIGGFYPGLSREEVSRIINGLGPLKGAQCDEIDVAKAALYLASDDAKYVTGHDLVVDGGFTCFKNLSFPTPDQFVV